MPRILITDTYYPDFLKSWQFNESAAYDTELNRLLDFEFGTGRAYSRNLKLLGWDAVDVIANSNWLRERWSTEHGGRSTQIHDMSPDVLFVQDLSWFTVEELKDLRVRYLLAGQCSCPMPPYEKVQQFHILFTSFPHYLKKFEEAGVRAVYNPLGFEHRILERICGGHPMVQPKRIHDVVFIGGVGNPSHWKRGMETLHAVAEAIPTFKWWGYGQDLLPEGPLKQKYQGQAWGLDMYKILLQSRICLNRHGEVTEGYANNMRMFEASGTGCLLLTEKAPNLRDFFTGDEAIGYDSPEMAVNKIRLLLEGPPHYWQDVAAAGQARTLRDHAYAQRMKTVSETLKGML